MGQEPFAKNAGVSVHVLRSWLYRLRREAGLSTGTRKQAAFVEVREVAGSTPRGAYRLHLGNGISLELAELPPAAWLREVNGSL